MTLPGLSTVWTMLQAAWTAHGHVQSARGAAELAGRAAHAIGLTRADEHAHHKPEEHAHGRPYRRR